MNTVLLVAFHFPPLRGSSGILRTLGYARHLPGAGWRTIVLTASSFAYPSLDQKQLQLIPEETIVERAFCLDTARHLAFLGRYPDRLALPDRWCSWQFDGIRKGKALIKQHAPAAIWSTYPISTAHRIGYELATYSGLPWIADFRDPMVEQDERTGAWVPGNQEVRNARLKIESECVRLADALVFCTEGARDICLERHAELDSERCHVISNGYEEDNFQQAIRNMPSKAAQVAKRGLTLLHSGTIYPTSDRDPTAFFDALAELVHEGSISIGRLTILLRATGHDTQINKLIEERQLDNIVSLLPSIPYLDALQEMMAVDGLLVLQGYTSNPAIPAKIYEYMRAQKPILGLVDHAGSTARLLRRLNAGFIASIENKDEIKAVIRQFIKGGTTVENVLPVPERYQAFSRGHTAQQLSEVLNSICRVSNTS